MLRERTVLASMHDLIANTDRDAPGGGCRRSLTRLHDIVVREVDMQACTARFASHLTFLHRSTVLVRVRGLGSPCHASAPRTCPIINCGSMGAARHPT